MYTHENIDDRPNQAKSARSACVRSVSFSSAVDNSRQNEQVLSQCSAERTEATLREPQRTEVTIFDGARHVLTVSHLKNMFLDYTGRTCNNKKLSLQQRYRLLCMYRLHALCKGEYGKKMKNDMLVARYRSHFSADPAH